MSAENNDLLSVGTEQQGGDDFSIYTEQFDNSINQSTGFTGGNDDNSNILSIFNKHQSTGGYNDDKQYSLSNIDSSNQSSSQNIRDHLQSLINNNDVNSAIDYLNNNCNDKVKNAINIQDSDGNTLLHQAVKNGNNELAEVLENCGANREIANYGGEVVETEQPPSNNENNNENNNDIYTETIQFPDDSTGGEDLERNINNNLDKISSIFNKYNSNGNFSQIGFTSPLQQNGGYDNYSPTSIDNDQQGGNEGYSPTSADLNIQGGDYSSDEDYETEQLVKQADEKLDEYEHLGGSNNNIRRGVRTVELSRPASSSSKGSSSKSATAKSSTTKSSTTKSSASKGKSSSTSKTSTAKSSTSKGTSSSASKGSSSTKKSSTTKATSSKDNSSAKKSDNKSSDSQAKEYLKETHRRMVDKLIDILKEALGLSFTDVKEASKTARVYKWGIQEMVIKNKPELKDNPMELAAEMEKSINKSNVKKIHPDYEKIRERRNKYYDEKRKEREKQMKGGKNFEYSQAVDEHQTLEDYNEYNEDEYDFGDA